MTDVAPAAPEPPTPDPVAPARRPRRVWDLVLTIVLLVGYLVITAIGSGLGFFLAFAGDSCGASSVCDYDRMGTGMTVAVYGVWAPVLIVVILSIVLLALRRLAFWVPLAGILLTIALVVTGGVLVFGAVSAG
jgi:hypothetical protein